MTNSVERYCCFWLIVVFLLGAVNPSAAETKTYRIGLTPVFLSDRTAFLEEWQSYLTSRLDKPVEFIQRQTYQEVTDLLLSGDLDAAWLCGYPYLRNRNKLKLLGVPLFNGKPFYKSYLIVPSSDQYTEKLDDLRQKVFAFSDPDSNSGFLYPQASLIKSGIEPKYFFARTFFTWSHRDVVKAVAEGMAHGGAVDGYVWETLAKSNPQLTNQTRIVARSQDFGFPPLVVRRDIKPQHESALRQVLLEMSADRDGLRLLNQLNLDGFTEGDDALYQSIAELIKVMDQN